MLKRRLLRALGHQRYLRFGVRDRILRRFDDPARADATEFVTPFFGARYRGQFDSFIDWSTYYYGAYSRDDLDLIDDLLTAWRHPVFVDVGANVGHHTLFAATRCRRVIAIEPFEPLTRRIQQKIDENGLTNVTIVTCGLAERDGVAAYVPPTTHNRGTGAFGVPEAGSVSLPVRRGDDVLAEAGASAPSFIKIDTEGLEPQVLRGLAKTLAGARPMVFVEWLPGPALAVREEGRALFPAGYAFYRRRPDDAAFGVFRRAPRRLEQLSDTWPEADILAVPVELRDRLASDAAAARAASRLSGD
jgi:FkbM family methyltransferase